jgi:hypothetical protein
VTGADGAANISWCPGPLALRGRIGRSANIIAGDTMTVITGNEWPQCGREDCERLLVPGTQDNAVRIELRRGDAATILTAWAAWFHHNVRPINTGATRTWWGWCASHEVSDSAHLSGTAVDLCAGAGPAGDHPPISEQEVGEIHRGLGLFEGTVFWGRWWEPAEEKHFQIWLPPAHPQIHQFAERLWGGYLDILGPAASAVWHPGAAPSAP